MRLAATIRPVSIQGRRKHGELHGGAFGWCLGGLRSEGGATISRMVPSTRLHCATREGKRNSLGTIGAAEVEMVTYLDGSSVRAALGTQLGRPDTSHGNRPGPVLHRPRDSIYAQRADLREMQALSGHHACRCGNRNGCQARQLFPGQRGHRCSYPSREVLLFRLDTGEPLAVMNGRLVTEMRTAAVSAAITRCRAPANDWVLAILGTSFRTRAHLTTLSHSASMRSGSGAVSRNTPCALPENVRPWRTRMPSRLCEAQMRL